MPSRASADPNRSADTAAIRAKSSWRPAPGTSRSSCLVTARASGAPWLSCATSSVHRRLEPVLRPRVVEEAGLPRPSAVERLAGQEELPRRSRVHPPQARDGDDRRGHPDAHLAEAERRRREADREVAGGDQAQAPGAGAAVDARDHRPWALDDQRQDLRQADRWRWPARPLLI